MPNDLEMLKAAKRRIWRDIDQWTAERGRLPGRILLTPALHEAMKIDAGYALRRVKDGYVELLFGIPIVMYDGGGVSMAYCLADREVKVEWYA